eukprot:SAG11_NODE_1564_length_4675_cov_2.781687_7_plen_70_part_00
MSGKYAVDLAGFERVALPAIAPRTVADAESGMELLLIDEIGKMELVRCRPFTTPPRRLARIPPIADAEL